MEGDGIETKIEDLIDMVANGDCYNDSKFTETVTVTVTISKNLFSPLKY